MTQRLQTECAGSPGYCAPEVLDGQGYEGFPTDIWSCGICLFAMGTSRLPFEEANEKDQRFRVYTQYHCTVLHGLRPNRYRNYRQEIYGDMPL